MVSLRRIIKEEYVKLLKEINYNRDEDIDYSQFEREDEIKREMFNDFLYHNTPDFTKHVPWTVIPFPRLKKIWEDFMTYGSVRDTRGLEMIEDIIQTNILKLYVNTELSGHSEVDPKYDFEEYGYTEQDMEDFWSYIDKISDYAFNDFGGRRLGLTTLLGQVRKARTPEEKLPILDQILNVVHQTSDLASYFVEGGSSALSQLSGSPSQVPA